MEKGFSFCTLVAMSVMIILQETYVAGYVVSKLGSGRFCAKLHNNYRKQHNTSDLHPDFQLAQRAASCAKFMIRRKLSGEGHPCNPGRDREGENIYTYNYGSVPRNRMERHAYFRMAVRAWYDEVNYINFKSSIWYMTVRTNNPRKPIGHFTQVVWRKTTRVGCGLAYRNGQRTVKVMVVCRYSPPGNQFNGASLRDNVHPPLPGGKRCIDKIKLKYCLAVPCSKRWKVYCPKTCGFCKP